MDQPLERLLSVLSGETSDEELKKELADPTSEAAAAMRALRIRTRSAFRIKRSVLESDPNLLPLLKFADLCSPVGFKMLPPKEGTRITEVLVKRLKEPRGRLVAVAKVTLNKQVLVRGIRIVDHEKHGIQARMPRGQAFFYCPECGTMNLLHAKHCVGCRQTVPRGPDGRLLTSVLTTTRHKPQVVIRDKELRNLIRQRVLARYHELIVEEEGGGQSLEPQASDVSPGKALQLSLHFAAPDEPPEEKKEASAAVPPKGGEGLVGGESAEGGGGSESSDEGPSFPTATDFAVDHPLLKKYWSPAERLAIMLHWFHQCAEQGREIAMAEAIGSWEAGAGKVWRAERFWRDMSAQIDEINRHKWVLSSRAGRDVGWDAAEEDWLKNHAAGWRKWREQDIESL